MKHPAPGELDVDLGRVIVVDDEIDLLFGRRQSRVGGGLADHTH